MRKKCNYTISLGLIDTIIALTKMEKGEIWSTLEGLAQVCFDRLDEKENKTESWRWVVFPRTEIRIKIKVCEPYRGSDKIYRCSIKVDTNRKEYFTSDQIDEFLAEKILLGGEYD